MALIDEIMERIPTAARIYYTGTPGGRRYRRASVLSGPGEPLVFRSNVERELRRLLDAAPKPPAATAAPSDDCDDVDAILRIVGLDPERCRTEGGALNVGRVRTLWEDVVSLAAQASGQAAPSDEEIFEVARAAGLDHGVIQDDAYRSALGIPRGTRYILMDVKPGQTLAFARALLSRYGRPAGDAQPVAWTTQETLARLMDGRVGATVPVHAGRTKAARVPLYAAPQPAAQAASAVPQDTPEAINSTIQVLKECGGFTEQAPVIRQLRRYATLLAALTTQGASHE